MIGNDQVVNGVWMGTILILLGMVPGLFQAIESGIGDLANLLTFRFAFPIRHRVSFKQPQWFATAGVLVIAATFLAYFAR